MFSKIKIILTLIVTLSIVFDANSQVAINETGSSPDPSSILDISSTNKGLLIPRVTTTQRNAIVTTQSGLMVYDTNTESFWYYDSTQATWVEIIVDGNLDIDDLSDAISDGASVFLGNNSGTNDDGSNYNSAIGVNSLYSNTSGLHNTSLGSDNMFKNTTGSRNTVVGRRGNYYNQEGVNNTIIGYAAGMGSSIHNKSGNIFLGYMSGYYETGDNKLYIENSSSSTPLIGGDFSTNEIYFNGSVKITGGSPGVDKILTSDANGVASWEDNGAAFNINGLSDGKTDGSSVFLGDSTGYNDDGNNWNTGVGFNALPGSVSGQKNTSIGYKSMFRNVSGSNNTAIGYLSMVENLSGDKNTALGSNSLYWNTTGVHNVAIGFKSLLRNGTGTSNVAIGCEALYFNTTKSNLVAIGDSALYYNGNNVTSGNQAVYNTAVGSRAMLHTTTGHNNSTLGYKSMYFNETGSHNISIGHESLMRSVSGGYNVAMGSYSSSFNATGDHNVNIGYGSDYNNTGGSNNTIIGYKAGFGSTGVNRSGNIFIGREAGFNETGNDKLYIDNSSSPTPLIGGDFSSDELYFNTTKLGIGTTDPNELLEVAHPSNDYGRMIVSDGGGSNRNALLFVSPKASAQYARIEAYNYGTASGVTLKFNTTGEGDCVFGGKVGIGTNSPLGPLHVHSSTQNTFAYITPTASQSGDSSSILLAEDEEAKYGMYWMYDGDGNEMELWGKARSLRYGPHMLIKRNTGDIAIGGENFATGYKLSVEGKVICEEVKVSLHDDWPDYVFDENYNLMPINGFRDYISENGHLPNIPSATDIDNAGVELGEMQRLLLEKVEELSLYILRQEDRITKLEDELYKTKK